MTTPLWFTADEATVFTALPEAVRNGWEVREETLSFADSEEKRAARLSLLRLHDPKLLKFQADAEKIDSPDAMAALFAATDLQGVSEDDLAELFFALGPDLLTRVIRDLLAAVKTDADLDAVASLLLIRHSLLEALSRS